MRVSDRAQRVRLVMRPEGLEVVIPHGFDRRRIPGILESKRRWIKRASGLVEERRRRMEDDPPKLPERVTLPAIGEEWTVEYRPAQGGNAGDPKASAAARVRETSGKRLLVAGDPEDFTGCRDALCRWLSRRARRELVARLDELAVIHGLEYGKVTVRQQRTRWGSCSHRKNISLNARLLLLPSEAADYVLLHELCHTMCLDHSPRFWALMETHDPDYREHKKMVRDSAKALPTWLEHNPDDTAI